MDDLIEASTLPKTAKPARGRRVRTAEPIVEESVDKAALEAMARMMDPVLVVGEVEPLSADQTHAATFHNYVRDHIEALQQHLRPGEELFVYVHTGYEVIRVMNMAMPDWHLVVLTGLDADDNPAQLITNVRNVRFVCKLVKVSPEHKHNPIGFKFPAPATAPSAGPADAPSA